MKKVIGAIIGVALVVAFIISAPKASRFDEERASLERNTIVILAGETDQSSNLATKVESERPSTEKKTIIYTRDNLEGEAIEADLF